MFTCSCDKFRYIWINTNIFVSFEGLHILMYTQQPLPMGIRRSITKVIFELKIIQTILQDLWPFVS